VKQRYYVGKLGLFVAETLALPLPCVGANQKQVDWAVKVFNTWLSKSVSFSVDQLNVVFFQGI
jgi:hypothetical protein